MKIGIIKEGKKTIDRRVPFTPENAREILERFEGAEVGFEPSEIRCFSDSDYLKQGISKLNKLSSCDLLFGIKEVPPSQLVEGKTYFFFSHTIKKQPYNRELLRTVLAKNIRLVDYELLTDPSGQRIIAFGRYAGIVGAYNGLIAYGERYKLYRLKPAHQCLDIIEMISELKKITLPPIKIVLTGRGRVSRGCVETLRHTGIRQVSPQEYLSNTFSEPVFTQLESRNYIRRSDGKPLDVQAYYQDPAEHESSFGTYARTSDLLISGAYWNPKAPELFSRKDMLSDDFRIRVVADITCDIQGSIPCTLRSTTIEAPVFDYDPESNREAPAYSADRHITVMAVDNLPCELPRDASRDFGRDLIDLVLPSLLGPEQQQLIERATIAANGKLTKRYSYLQDFVDGKE
ncbi:MAG: NAD(P)-dependent oxidoreductase [Cytophagales bacterium]|nr:NAD(P)-dependent oxidoreductase [Cytophagales bacterium]